MYGLLVKWVNPRMASILTAIWFAALIIGVIIFSVDPSADFRYGRI